MPHLLSQSRRCSPGLSTPQNKTQPEVHTSDGGKMRCWCVLVGALAVLTTAETVSTPPPRPPPEPPTPPPRTFLSLFSSSRVHQERDGGGLPPRSCQVSSRPPGGAAALLTLFLDAAGVCLHGGSAVSSLASGEHLFCLCPHGFQGSNCEIGEEPWGGCPPLGASTPLLLQSRRRSATRAWACSTEERRPGRRAGAPAKSGIARPESAT